MNDHTFGSLVMGAGLSPYSLIALAVVSAIAGMFSHWMKKQYKDGMNVGWFSYFFVTNRRATLQAVLGGLTGLFAAFAPIDYTTISGYQVVLQAFAIGYAVDSAFNSTDGNVAATEAKEESKAS